MSTLALQGEQSKAVSRGKIGRAIKAGARTNVEIANATGLSRATISRYADDVAMFIRQSSSTGS